MTRPTIDEIRAELFRIVEEQRPKHPNDSPLQQVSIFTALDRRLNLEQQGLSHAVLTLFHDLMRTGYFAWGHNLSNFNPPFFHVTDRGARAIAIGTRDPINPSGYQQHLANAGPLNAVATSYLQEALDCFGAGLFKAAAVMIGTASESVVLELRDTVVSRLQTIQAAVPKDLNDWRVKMASDALERLFESRKSAMPHELRDEFSAYWGAFTQQIRATRNDAGHPVSINPVTEDAVHAAFLVFPLLLRLANDLGAWTAVHLT